MSRHPITCHILDTTRGKPAAGVSCAIFRIANLPNTTDNHPVNPTNAFGIANTDADGRISKWTLNGNGLSSSSNNVWNTDNLLPGIYKIRFETLQYFVEAAKEDLKNNGIIDLEASKTFFPFVEVSFIVRDPPDAHYHIPLLLSNYSYSTYRGS